MGSYSNSIDFNIGNSKLSFNQTTATKIPIISEKTIEILSNDSFVIFQKSQKDSLSTPLASSIKALLTLQVQYNKAKSNEKKDKIISVIKAALYISFIAGTVFAVMTFATTPFIAVSIIIPAIIISAIAARCFTHSTRRGGINLLFNMIFTPGITIYQSFTKVPNLQKQFTAYKNEIENNFKNTHIFFQQKFGQFKTNMIQNIKDCQNSIDSLKNLKFIPEDFEAKIEKRKNEFEIAVAELESCIEYFSSIN